MLGGCLLASLAVPVTYWLPPLASGIMTAGMAILIVWRRPSRPATTLGLYLSAAAIWCIGYCFQLCAPTLAAKVFWSKVQYVGPAGVSLAGLLFVLQYCGFNGWLRLRPVLLLSFIPALTQVLVWTNERHGLIWKREWMDVSGAYPLMARTHGWWFWIFSAYAYSLCATSIALLGRQLFSRQGIYRSQIAVLLVGCMVPLAGNVMYTFGFEPIANLDLTPFFFSITGLSMVWGLFRFQLPVILPMARQTLFEGMRDAVIAFDVSGNVVEVNPETTRVLGQAGALLLGRPAATALQRYPELLMFCSEQREARRALTIESNGEARRFDATCSLLRIPGQKVIGSLVVLRDVTEHEKAEEALWQAHLVLEQRIDERTADLSRTIEELRTVENQLTFNATHDSLTGLGNRKLFLDRVEQRLGTDKGEGKASFAVLFLDLDRFKIYNDGFGHHFGDSILIEMGRRIESCFKAADTVARIGGDEFTILIDEARDAEEASQLANQCLRALAEPGRLEGNDIYLTASIGIAIPSDQRCGAEALMRNADLAMYRAKRQGGNESVFFGDSMRLSALSLVKLEQDLRLAIPRHEIFVQYQPFVRMQTGQVVGFEALVRWRHPERGLLLPAEFLPMAEQTGMLIEIDELVLREACGQMDAWYFARPGGEGQPFVSVNVAGWQFAHPKRWWQALSGLDGHANGLRLEMVESVLVANAHAASEFFEQVRAHNLPIYLDDFGTGYSSLSWLSKFPIRSLKIDRSFVKEVTAGGKDTSIIQAIIALADSLKIEVVAEGIESAEQAKVLQELGCEYGQGFLYSRPVNGAETMAMLQ